MTIDYGFDTSCTTDLTPGHTVTDARLVAEAMFRRVTTRRGSVIDAPNDGIDLRDFIQSEGTTAELAAVEGQVRAECYKDDRVLEGTLSVEATFVAGDLRVRIRGLTSNRDEFELVALASELTVQLLKGGAV